MGHRWAFVMCAAVAGCGTDTSTAEPGADGAAPPGAGGAVPIAGSPGAGGNVAGGAAPGNGGTGGGSAMGSASMLSACSAYLVAQCERRVQCAVEKKYSCAGEPDQCPDGVFSTGSTRTIEGTLACAEAWKTFPCDELAIGKFPSCATPGTRTPGQTCAYNMQCSSNNCTALNGCGICQDLAPLDGPCHYPEIACPQGQTCGGSKCFDTEPLLVSTDRPAGSYCGASVDCATGLACFHDDAASSETHCAPPPVAGSPCGVGVSASITVCADGATCVGGTCVPLLGLGQTCLPSTNPSQCVADAYCNGATQRCLSRVSTGSACYASTYFLHQANCSDGLACFCSDAACSGGSCFKPLAEGAPCPEPGAQCIPNTACTGGRCTATDALTKFAELCP